MRYVRRRLLQTVMQHPFGASVAFAATGADIEVGAQLDHGAHAGIDGLPDGSVGDVVADADDHVNFLRKQKQKK